MAYVAMAYVVMAYVVMASAACALMRTGARARIRACIRARAPARTAGACAVVVCAEHGGDARLVDDALRRQLWRGRCQHQYHDGPRPVSNDELVRRAYVVMAYIVMALYSYGLYSYGLYGYGVVDFADACVPRI